MSKSKKLSQEEKRTRLLEFFHEKKDVFILKELEKVASKEKGIPFQTIKDILSSLVSDDFVDTDKIGTSTYFWSFPSKSYQKKLEECKKQEQLLNKLQEQENNLDMEIQEISNSIENDNDDIQLRNEIQEELLKLEKEKQELLIKFNKFKDYDPDTVQQLENQCKISREAVDRWTDNIFQIKSWCKKKFHVEDSEINKGFGIPSNFDYYEDDD